MQILRNIVCKLYAIMKPTYFISLYLDVRRPKKNDKFPLKLRVFTPMPRKQKLYNTVFDFTQKEFSSIWETKKPRKEHNETRLKLQALENRANDVASILPYFSFEAFERSYLGKTKQDKNSIILYYENALIEYYKNNQLNTASSYKLSLKSLLNFHGKDTLTFYEITPSWLNEYENWMVNKRKLSKATVGIYLRALRAIFNNAIHDNAIDPNAYPFGKRNYQIPAPKSVKKALLKDQIKTLFNELPDNPMQVKAKDFWFLSYSCDGMNIRDIANLKFKDFKDNKLTYRREKTVNTRKTQMPSTIFVNAHTIKVIDKYSNENKSSDNYIFDILESGDDPEEQLRKVKKFTRFINQHFRKYAKICGIDIPISPIWARHSFATTMIRNGASMEHVSERMHEGNLVTTKTYFAGFEDETKRDMTEKLLEF